MPVDTTSKKTKRIHNCIIICFPLPCNIKVITNPSLRKQIVSRERIGFLSNQFFEHQTQNKACKAHITKLGIASAVQKHLGSVSQVQPFLFTTAIRPCWALDILKLQVPVGDAPLVQIFKGLTDASDASDVLMHMLQVCALENQSSPACCKSWTKMTQLL